MEISKGRFPQTTEIDGAVKVGSPLTLAIFVKDPRKRTDVRIKDCYGKEGLGIFFMGVGYLIEGIFVYLSVRRSKGGGKQWARAAAADRL